MFSPGTYAVLFIALILGWPFFWLDHPLVFWPCLLTNTSFFGVVTYALHSRDLSFWRGLSLLCGSYMSGNANITLIYIFFFLAIDYIRMLGAVCTGLYKGKARVEKWWIQYIERLQHPGKNPNQVEPKEGIEHGYPHLSTIRKSIKALYQHLSSQTIKGHDSSLPAQVVSEVNDPDPTLAVQRVASKISQHFNLPNGSILVNFRPSLKTPAQVELTPDDAYLVDLHTRYRDDRCDIPAILAHEITHVFLYRAKLIFPVTQENEILTDTAAMYLGVGWPCLNAYRRTVEQHQAARGFDPSIRTFIVREEKLGYLTPEEFGYVLAKRSLAFNEKLDQHLTAMAKKAYRSGLRMAIADYRHPPLKRCGLGRRILYNWHRRLARKTAQRAAHNHSAKGSHQVFKGYRFELSDPVKVVFDCPVCCQKLRVPIDKGDITLRCRVCDTDLSCST